jgi:hypothetical protein
MLQWLFILNQRRLTHNAVDMLGECRALMLDWKANYYMAHSNYLAMERCATNWQFIATNAMTALERPTLDKGLRGLVDAGFEIRGTAVLIQKNGEKFVAVLGTNRADVFAIPDYEQLRKNERQL